MPLPFGQIPVGEGRLPDGTTAPFYVDRYVLDRLAEDGPAWKFDDAWFITEAVESPDAIFRGLKRPNQSDGLGYSVRPTRGPDDADADAADDAKPLPVYGRAFLAFAEAGQMGYVVFDWEWREEDGADPGHPLNWQTDFVERAWHRS